MTFVTSEPYIGHLGLDGVGDTKGLLESEMRERHIKWITNAKVASVEAGVMHVEEIADDGSVKATQDLPFAFSMMLPAFRGVAAVRGIEGLTNPRGFIIVDKHQRNPTFPNVFALGVCVAIAADRQDAGARGRAQDRLHDREHGHRHRPEHRRRSSRPSRPRTRRPGTPSAWPISATAAWPSSPSRRSRRATSTGRPAASGSTSPRPASRNTSWARSSAARASPSTNWQG